MPPIEALKHDRMQYIQQGRTFFMLLIRGRGITYTDEKETATRAIKARTERMVKRRFFFLSSRPRTSGSEKAVLQ